MHLFWCLVGRVVCEGRSDITLRSAKYRVPVRLVLP